MAVKWYEFKGKFTRQIHKVCNPTFVIEGGNWLVSAYYTTEAEFNRVLAEWEADQVEQCGNSNSIPVKGDPEKGGQQQWVPKVGDWVRVKGSGRTRAIGSVGRVESLSGVHGVKLNVHTDYTFASYWLEPATPQPIDKLGWWLIDGERVLVNARDGDGNFVASSGRWAWLKIDKQGILLAEITDEELTDYHRNRIVPKCPVEVKS